MSFGAPLLLLGLLATAAPVIVHLIHRRRAPRVQFTAMSFLLASHKRSAPHLRLKRILLLAARILFFVALPLAMARPSCGGNPTQESDEAATNRLPASVVIILDDSASMSAPYGRNTRWDEAVNEVERQLRDLRTWDQATVVVASNPLRQLTPRLEVDPGPIRQALRNFEPSWGVSDLVEALRRAAELHTEAKQGAQRTILITDNTRVAWEPLASSPLPSPLGNVLFVDVSGRASTNNVAITRLVAEPELGSAAGTYRLSATLRRYGDWPTGLQVELQVDGSPVGVNPVELSDADEAVVSFLHPLRSGAATPIEANLRGASGPHADDRRTMILQPSQAVRVLIVDGDPRAVAINSESYFLSLALGAQRSGERGRRVRVVPAEEFRGDALAQTDVLVLANVESLSSDLATEVLRFVEAGGGLLLTVGERVSPSRWNTDLAALLPRPLRSLQELSRPGAPDASLHATHLGLLEPRHALGRSFPVQGSESLRTALVHKLMLVEASEEADTTLVAAFTGGAPALIERRIGQGRVFLWTTSIDADWTDLPLATAYVPFVQRMIEVLAQAPQASESEATVGRNYRIHYAEEDVPERVILETPRGERMVLLPEGATLSVPVQSSGAWRVFEDRGAGEQRMELLDFAANTPLEEADLSPWPELDITEILSAANAQGGTDHRALPGARKPAWPMLLLVALFALYAESLLAVRRRAWRSIRMVFQRVDKTDSNRA